jgi:hypothetical protein
MLLVNEEYDTFLSGRIPPKFDLDNLDHPILIEWYKEQIKRCVLGYEHKGYRITGEHYFMLNFVPIRRFLLDYNGNPTKKFETEYPLWSQADDRIFKQIEEAKQSNLDFMLMTSRSFGKTYISLALALREYVCFEESHSIVMGTSLDAVKGTFNQKLIPSLNELEERHVFLKQKRLVDTEKEIKSGEKISKEEIDETKGRKCILERIIFTKQGATAGRRATLNIFEEIGEWDKNPSLKECINNTKGISNVGDIKQGFTMYIGTGGSIASDQARDIFFSPEAYELYIPKDCDRNKYEKGHAVFMPAYTKYGGCYESTGYTNEELALEKINIKRKSKEDDIEALNMLKQQYPLTLEEMFMKNTTRVFSSLDLAQQHTYITQKILKNDEDYFLRVGDLIFKNGMKEVIFVDNPNGRFKMIEEPERLDGEVPKNLYCMGVDSIDMGNDDSADKTGKNRSKLGFLIKKRISPVNPLGDVCNNSYVAMYLYRADDVEDNYEDVLKAAIYFNCNVMLEYTRTRIVTYFKRYKQDWRFCKRPDIGSSSFTESESVIGYKADEKTIKHYIGVIKEYIKETSCRTIFFKELLEQLIDYTYEEKGKFDLIAAMGGCELHDEQLTINHIVARKPNKEVSLIGWYTDAFGVKRRGSLNDVKKLNFGNTNFGIIDYIDATDKNNIKIVKR